MFHRWQIDPINIKLGELDLRFSGLQVVRNFFSDVSLRHLW